MDSAYPWVYIDGAENVWKFTTNEAKELHYKIMYGEGKWTKESLIDTGVLGYAVYAEEDETIHIVYSSIDKELKYCTMKNRQWIGRTLYKIENDDFEVCNLKLIISGNEMHVFYMLAANDGSDHGILTHCRWNGKEVKVEAIQDFIMVPNVEEHYKVQLVGLNELDLFFIADEGDEVSLKHSKFEMNRWSTAKRLYGILGIDISFEIITSDLGTHILNKSKEGSKYLLDYVLVDINGTLQGTKIYESSNELLDPLIYNEKNKLIVCWREEKDIYYSTYDYEKWSLPIKFETEVLSQLYIYNCIVQTDEDIIKLTGLYGNDELDLWLLLPSEIIKDKKSLVEEAGKNMDSVARKSDSDFQEIKDELFRLKELNKLLEKKITSFHMQLQKKQRFVEEYEESLVKILEQKRKIEETCNIYMEVQQNLQKELEEVKFELKQEKSVTIDLRSKIELYEDENAKLGKHIVGLKEENRLLQEELVFERNQSFFDRFLRKKSNEV